MPQLLNTNFAITTLSSSITSGSTSLSITSGHGTKFPTVGAGSGDYFKIRITNAAMSAYEIIEVTEHAAGNDSFPTIVRGVEGTSPASWNAGDLIELCPTAGMLEDMLIQTQPRPQCILISVSAGNIRLDPFQGRHIPLNTSSKWRLRRVPAAGVAHATGSLALNTTRYVYAYWTGTAIALELSTTAFSLDDLTGLPYKTGDVTRLLVGAVMGNDSAAIDVRGRMWGVSSYWNRLPRQITQSSTGNQTLTGDSTWKLTPGITAPITVWSWGDDKFTVSSMLATTLGTTFAVIPNFGVSGTSPYVGRYAEDGQGSTGGGSSGTIVHDVVGLSTGLTTFNPLYFANAAATFTDGRASLQVSFTA